MSDDMEHIKELLNTHAGYMNQRMDQIHTAVMDSTQMIAEHETRLTVVEKHERRASRWGSIAGAIGGFVSGFLGGKVGG